MTNEEIIEKTRKFLEEKFAAEGSGHDYWHMHRVWMLARRIAQYEQDVNMFNLELAALLHDIADWKFHNGDEDAGARAARKWLASIHVSEATITHVEDIVRNVSYKGAGIETNMASIEGKIVQDADRLDAMGAIGIARTFAYGGWKDRPMYDPAITPEQHNSFEAYKNNNGTTINHFYEKLLLLKDRMLTKTGTKMAEHRHKVLEQFLDEFYAEWDGKA